MQDDASATHPRMERHGARRFTGVQVAAIRSVMRLFVEDDLANGVPYGERGYCDACRRSRPRAGFIRYEGYRLCNRCATDYELARGSGWVVSVGRFVADRHAGRVEDRQAPAACRATAHVGPV